MSNHPSGADDAPPLPSSSGAEFVPPLVAFETMTPADGDDVDHAIDEIDDHNSGVEITPRPARPSWWEIGVAVAIFVAFCGLVSSKSPQLLEPDDYAYRASIVALSHGDVTLTAAQYQALAKELGGTSITLPTAGGNVIGPGSAPDPGGLGIPSFGAGGPGGDGPKPGFGGPGDMGSQGIMQWVKRADGTYISEKNPGYPYLALPFQAMGILRAAPLFYGGLACLALFAGLRRWVGSWAGTWAVALFCASGAAAAFAWRSTMPTFTDASLIAVGVGTLIWAFLATDRADRWRTIVGLAGFVALEAAVAIRYTNIIFLIVAIVAAVVFLRRTSLPKVTAGWWGGSLVAFALLMAWWNLHYYGSPLSTGYSSGEITFSLGSIGPNLIHMPAHLVKSMPMIVLALAGLVWMIVRLVQSRSLDGIARGRARRDATIGAVLAAGWFGLWVLYLAYDWTVRMAGDDHGGSIHTIRFYMPALGVIAALGAWLLVQLPRWLAPVTVAGLMAVSVSTFGILSTDQGSPGGHRPDGGFGQIGQPGGPGDDGLMPDGFPPGMGPGEDAGQDNGS